MDAASLLKDFSDIWKENRNSERVGYFLIEGNVVPNAPVRRGRTVAQPVPTKVNSGVRVPGTTRESIRNLPRNPSDLSLL